MKKTISLFLALVLCLSLCACSSSRNSSDGTSNGGNSNEVKLTLENYSKYLSITARVNDPSAFDGGGLNVQSKNNGAGIPYDGGNTYYVYNYLNQNVFVEGASTNFNYNDISVTVRFTGTYKTVDIQTSEWDSGNEFSSDVIVECDIAGKGGKSEKFTGNGGYLLRDMADIKWEVVAISGTVTPAN